MSQQHRHHASRTLSAAFAILTLVVAATVSDGCSKAPADSHAGMSMPSASAPAPASTGTPKSIEVVIPQELRTRAGIEMELPVRRAMSSRLRLPGSIAPDAYGQVMVLALAGGRVTGVAAELGTEVREGQPLVTIVSTDVAEAQADYLTHRAAVEIDHQRLQRLERLVAIGAEPQQALDDATAMHASHTSEFDRAAARLKLLGFRATDIDQLAGTGDITAQYIVRAPAAGVVTRRDVNEGQNVATDAPIMQISRLDRVWVVASAYEQDAGQLHAGMPADVSRRGESAQPIRSRIAYVDPQVEAATRTAQVRVELPNANRALRFGMLVDVDIQLPGGTDALTVPAEAVQSIGDMQVVYVQDAHRPDVLIETPVDVGTTDHGRSQIRRGLTATDRVVTHGASFVRAERLRIHPTSD